MFLIMAEALADLKISFSVTKNNVTNSCTTYTSTQTKRCRHVVVYAAAAFFSVNEELQQYNNRMLTLGSVVHKI